MYLNMFFKSFCSLILNHFVCSAKTFPKKSENIPRKKVEKRRKCEQEQHKQTADKKRECEGGVQTSHIP